MPWSYASLAAFKSRLADSLTADDTIYRSVLEAVSRHIDAWTGHQFRTFLATRYFTAEDYNRLGLDVGLLAAPTLKTDDDGDRTYEHTWAATDYDLLPLNASADMRPYITLAISPRGTLQFPRGVARGVEIAGKWGFYEDLLSVSTLTEALDASATAVKVASGAAFEILQTILIDSEQMYVTGISSNTLTVERAVNGTSPAEHLLAASVKRYRYPGQIVEATVIQAVRTFKRKDAPFGVVGGADMSFARNIPELDPDVTRLLYDYTWWSRRFA